MMHASVYSTTTHCYGGKDTERSSSHCYTNYQCRGLPKARLIRLNICDSLLAELHEACKIPIWAILFKFVLSGQQIGKEQATVYA